jgi:galactose mutarotase-like enzyme
MASCDTGEISGWQSVVLQTEELRVEVLPAKGAEIHRLVDRRSGINLLFQAPWGLPPPGAPPLPGSGDDPFMWNYAGGWQDLFPSVNDACSYRGRSIPFHGEVAGLEWEHDVLESEEVEAAVRFWTRCRETPFLVEKRLRLRDGEPEIVIQQTVTNESPESAHFVCGHHCVLGPPFLEQGCTLDLSGTTIRTSPQLWEPETARLAPGQEEGWPNARLRTGGTVDLRRVPGRDAGSHDDVFVGVDAGWATVSNERLGMTFALEWDPSVYGWVVLWQPYGGAVAQPLAGSYALGVEPWSSRLNLEDAVAAGEAIELAAGATFETVVRVRVEHDR